MKIKQKLGYLFLFIPVVVGLFVFFKHNLVLLITTGSMSPTMPQGTVIIVRRGTSPSTGDVATYESKGGNYITHRVVATELLGKDRLFYTQGDANGFQDPFPVGIDSIVGVTVFSFPYLGYALAGLLSPLALLFLFYIPTGYAFGKLINRFVNQRSP